jgi:cell wall-associated NlpC family hydrolase
MGKPRSDRGLGSVRWWRVAAIVAAFVALASVAIWRWMPGKLPASPAMRSAMSTLTSVAMTDAPRPHAAAHPGTDRERLMAAAFAMEGIPYKFGAKGPALLDCSGFTKHAYAAVGVTLPDGSFKQASGEQPLATAGSLVAGDLLFYRWAGSDQISHVTMYAGDGWVVGTGSPGQPAMVVVYPLSSDVKNDGRVITYRHIKLPDEH